ncbi:MAG TPA: MBL fold metallo-hydrolase [Synergistaceae bacterium]|nr:MBL fold metallo-hydrolase [Synergistaceae bacterium]HPJ25685.1 MBL fold metallo-hydrolase [Synergistaceae bacterium]HPQ37630.1 MBL fold metallo-hydrolase [Synergistaceae bacterium]
MEEEHWVVDPGPGSLVQIHQKIPDGNPEELAGIILTHRHIDHSSDLNVLAEAMTRGGREIRGHVILPEDAVFSPEPVLFGYLREKIATMNFWKENVAFPLGKKGWIRGTRLIHHGVDCFGFRVYHPVTGHWGLVSDTAFFKELPSFFRGCRLLIVNVTLEKPSELLDHLSLEEAYALIEMVAPEMALITHMGIRILEKGPENIIPSNQKVTYPAEDGMIIDLQNIRILRPAMFESENFFPFDRGNQEKAFA